MVLKRRKSTGSLLNPKRLRNSSCKVKNFEISGKNNKIKRNNKNASNDSLQQNSKQFKNSKIGKKVNANRKNTSLNIYEGTAKTSMDENKKKTGIFLHLYYLMFDAHLVIIY
jgi:hypothetical protein